MYICRVEEDELIRVAQPLEVPDRPLDALIGVLPVTRDNEALIAARHLVVDPDTVPHEI